MSNTLDSLSDYQIAGAVYEKYCNGDPISNEELEIAIEVLEPTVDALVGLGPRFHLAFKEANHFLMQLKTWQKARKGVYG